MAKQYYYFVTSLPAIQFGDKPPLSVEDFIGECQRLLPKEDYIFIKKLLEERVINYKFLISLVKQHRGEIREGNASLMAGIEFSKNFRNEIAWTRAQRANKDPMDYIQGEKYNDPRIAELVNQAYQTTNLLEGEIILDKTRWAMLDEIVSGHYFDLETIIIYGIRLKILERHQEIHSPKGREMFDEIKQMDISKLVKQPAD